MDKLFEILKETMPIQTAVLIVLFLYFLKIFRDLASQFVSLADKQVDFMAKRFETVDQTTGIFERTVKHQERDLERLYKANADLQSVLDEGEEQNRQRLDDQLSGIVEDLERLRQEKLSKAELDSLRAETEKAKNAISAQRRQIESIMAASPTEEAVSELRPVRSVLLAQPFTPGSEASREAISQVVADLGGQLIRLDEPVSSGSVMRHLHHSIISADVVVVDITGANSNVMYELGVAHGQGKPVVLLSKNPERIPFDIANLRVLIYDDTPEGIELLQEGLREALESLEVEDRRRESLKRVANTAAEILKGDYGSLLTTAMRQFI